MRHLIRLSCLALFALVLAGCAGTPGGKPLGMAPPDGPPTSAGNPEPAPTSSGDKDRAPSKEKSSEKSAPAKDGGPTSPPPLTPPTKAMMDEAKVGVDRPAPKPDATPAGVLTAGSFDDNLYPDYFRSFAGKVGQNSLLSDLPGKFLGQRLEVRVRNEKGQPVGNAKVRVNGKGNASAEATTRSDGRAIFVLSWDRLPESGELGVTATLPGGSTGSQRVAHDATDCTLLLPVENAPLPRNLDLAFVLDTTGSMGDELRYLKAEVKGIAAAVKAQFPDVNQRYGLVVYRDTGDEYLTRVFDFTSDLAEFQKNLTAQSVGGGGDIPEAMHQGLEAASKLRWREADTSRVLFLIADAPPHREDATKNLEQVTLLRQKGVAIYPVAASNNQPGPMEATEFHLRAMALLTGGQYLFLTDDSGVGDGHGEPRIPYYKVERLAPLMARLIAGELAGKRNDPDPGDVIRTVGKPPRPSRQD